MKDSLRHFLAGFIDYAGLFPPAALRLSEAIRNHRRYLGGDHGWLLGRFVVPVDRLEELPDDTAFPLAVIIPPEISSGGSRTARHVPQAHRTAGNPAAERWRLGRPLHRLVAGPAPATDTVGDQ